MNRVFPRSRWARSTGFAAAFFLLGMSSAFAARYWEVGPVLKSFFPSSKRVSPKEVSLSDATAADIAKKLGVSTLKRDWKVYVAERDGQRDGFAIVDQEKGMHEPIDFAVRFSTGGVVERIEILEYREAYGDEVRGERFRAQFRGKTANDPITAGKDIDIVSGASISSRSVALGVKRDTLILQAALKNGSL
jgi:Na+-translocating ferredoxin:NAD+ oxidoreductase RnfG subunit